MMILILLFAVIGAGITMEPLMQASKHENSGDPAKLLLNLVDLIFYFSRGSFFCSWRNFFRNNNGSVGAIFSE